MVTKNNKPYLIGLVGKAGSGKSTIAKILQEKYQFQLISLDEIGHRALEETKEELVKVFGKEIIGPDGNIQRNVLSRIVFGNMEKLLTLNAITHPRIQDIVKEKIKSLTAHTLLDGALLYEIGLAALCDFVVMIDAPEEILLKRLTKERGWSEEKSKSVLFSQRHLQFLREEADFIIFNNGTLEKTERQVDFFVHILL